MDVACTMFYAIDRMQTPLLGTRNLLSSLRRGVRCGGDLAAEGEELGDNLVERREEVTELMQLLVRVGEHRRVDAVPGR